MTEQAWYRKTLLIGLLTVLAICITALAIYLWENRPPEQTIQTNHTTEVKYIVNTQTVVKEVSEIDWDWFTITAYTTDDAGCNNITSIGIDVSRPWTDYFTLAAVDPDIIPYGSTVFIKHNGEILQALAVDTGGAIVGNRIDILVGSLEEAYRFGVQELQVGIIKSKEV